MSFYTNGTSNERVRIDKDGRLEIGRAMGSGHEPWGATGDVDAGQWFGVDAEYAFAINAKNIVGIFNRTNSIGVINEYKYNASVVGSVITDGTNLELHAAANNKMSAGGTVRLTVDTDGMTTLATRNSGNAGENVLRSSAFGIRTQDTGGYNWWHVDANYGGFSPFLSLRADRRIGVYKTSPNARVEFGYDTNQNGDAFVIFRGPNNKSGEMHHKYIHNGGVASSKVVNLLEVTSWQSSNSNIFGVVKVMGVDPLSSYGFQAEGWFFKDNDSAGTTGTVSTVHFTGGSAGARGSLDWDNDTLRYNTPANDYLNMHVSVEYHIYDGGTVVFDPDSRSF